MKTKEVAKENQKAAEAKIQNIEAASKTLKKLKGQISLSPFEALSVYSNVSLSGRHIIWKPKRH
jgi:hypothetical protein